jgi:primosomal protein N' (replication factor Y)
MPPFTFQALLRAEARTQELAQAFLHAVAGQALSLPGASHVTLYPPIAHTLQRVANVERAQMLLESTSRSALQAFLSAWQPILHATRALPAHRRLIRWAVDVDPLQI